MADTNAQRVMRAIATRFKRPVETISLETHFADDLRSDSLDIVEVAMELEDAFEIDMTDAEIRSIARVGDVIAIVDRLTHH